MAKLTSVGRNRIASGNFALPGRRFPIEDPNHARNALARVSQFGSSEEQEEVRRKVHAKYPGIGKSKGGYVPNPVQSRPSLPNTPLERPALPNERLERPALPNTTLERPRLSDTPGGYAPNKSHPRMHALALASATHLKNMGHITPEHHARIERHVNNTLMAMRAPQPAAPGGGDGAPAAPPFGSFAPPGMPVQ